MDTLTLILGRLAADGWRLWRTRYGELFLFPGEPAEAVKRWNQRGLRSGLALLPRGPNHPSIAGLIEHGPVNEGPECPPLEELV